MKIQTIERDITPVEASAILDKHYEQLAMGDFSQRPMKEGVARRYASDMKAGHWLFSPQPIIFDTENNLVDGQHRLEAVKMSGKTIRFIVSSGWPSKVENGVGLIDVIDSGRKRTPIEMLAMHGQKYASRYAGVARHWAMIATTTHSVGATYPMMVEILDKHNARAAVEAILSKTEGATNRLKDFTVPIIAALAFYWTTKPRKALQFADDMFNFTAEKGSPVQAFLQWNKLSRVTGEKLKGICSALRSHDLGETRQVIKGTQEAIRWLALTNPKLSEALTELCPRTY